MHQETADELVGGERHQLVALGAFNPHQETSNELVGGERHQLVALGAFNPVVLPFEGDALLIACDQAAIRDGHAVGVAREIAQHFLGATDPFAVAQRS
jgi:hypothetical protein